MGCVDIWQVDCHSQQACTPKQRTSQILSKIWLQLDIMKLMKLVWRDLALQSDLFISQLTNKNLKSEKSEFNSDLS